MKVFIYIYDLLTTNVHKIKQQMEITKNQWGK